MKISYKVSTGQQGWLEIEDSRPTPQSPDMTGERVAERIAKSCFTDEASWLAQYNERTFESQFEVLIESDPFKGHYLVNFRRIVTAAATKLAFSNAA